MEHRGLSRFILIVSFGLMSSCAHSPPEDKGPWSLIKNEDAREKYIMVQQAASSLSYKKLHYNIKLLNELYPEEDVITITHAGIYGDYGQTFDADKEKEYKKKAIQMLEPFIKKSYPSLISQDRILAFNQYYYHSGKFLEQYEYGKKIISMGGKGGEVLVAVGASMHALQLDKQNRTLEASNFAQEARKAWEEMYDMKHSLMREAAYQNAYYISSLALTHDCGKAQEIYSEKLMPQRRFQEMTRWYSQFEPKRLNSCSQQRQLTHSK